MATTSNAVNNNDPNAYMIANVGSFQNPYKDVSIKLKSDNTIAGDAITAQLDGDWSKFAFLIPDLQITDEDDKANRLYSSADMKYTDTRLGCNIGVNPRPQFTRYADIRRKGRYPGKVDVSIGEHTGDNGMGRYYSEAIDDPAQVVFFRFGVPQFNSLTNFVTSAYDTRTITLMATGRAGGFWRNVGTAMGTLARWVAFPGISTGVFVLQTLKNWFFTSTYKFYTLKPTMHLYWAAVNTLVNTLAVNLGIFPRIMNDMGMNNISQQLNTPVMLDQDFFNSLKKVFPELMNGQNAFDMYVMANKGQRLANHVFAKEYEAMANGNANLNGWLQKTIQSDTNNVKPLDLSNQSGSPSLVSFLSRWVMKGSYATDEEEKASEQNPRVGTYSKGSDGSIKNNSVKEPDGYWEHYDAEFNDGSQFAIFRPDHTRSMNESFSNSVVESDLSQKINSMSSQAKEIRFSFADGNINDTLNGILGAAKDVVSGALSGATFGAFDVLEGLVKGVSGGAYVDIPKHWQSSNANLPRASYTAQLISPYGNAVSRMVNIYIPLCMLLAGMLPRATGKASYTAPFICQCFDRGKTQTRLGIIDSLSINRGVTNLPHDIYGAALSIDVSWSVTDLSTIMAMPIGDGGILQWLSGDESQIDEDSLLMDYLAVLAGQDIYSQIYPMAKARLTLAKKLMGFQKFTSSAYWANTITNFTTTTAFRFFGPAFRKILASGNAASGGNPGATRTRHT